LSRQSFLKTLAQLGEGGPRQWWVRDWFKWEKRGNWEN